MSDPDQVICVDDRNPGNGQIWLKDCPIKGEIYTIRGTSGPDPRGTTGFLFFEIATGVFRSDGQEIGYRDSRFRPIRDESLDIFREMVAPKVDA